MIDRRAAIKSLGAAALVLGAPALRAAAVAESKWPLPPQPRREPRAVGKFGHHRTDDYAWMRAQDWHAVLRDPAALDAGIKAAVLAENAYTAAMLEPTRQFQSEIIARIEAIEAKRPTLELQDGGYIYYSRQEAGSSHPVYLRRAVAGGPEQQLLDVGAEARGKAFYSVHYTGPQRSANGELFGWAADATGSGIFSIQALQMSTGKRVVTDITNAHGSFTFSPDARHLFWVGRDDKGRPATVFRRDIAAGRDTLLHREADPAFFIGLKATASGRYVVIRIFNNAMSEVRLVPMRTPTAMPLLVEPRTAGLSYDVDDWNGQLIVLTDADGAVDYKLMSAREASPGRAHWRELVPHRPGRLIAAIHPFAKQLVREEWRDANPRLILMDARGGEKEIAFDEPAYAIAVPAGQSWTSPALTFTYQSPRLPVSIRRLDLADGSIGEAASTPRSFAYDADRYEVRRIFARAIDGAEIPITLLMRKGLALDASAPLFLYGYGSYGATVETEFLPHAVAMADQGWIYAIAHVRGGAEKGSMWWRSVLKHGKKTTFTDFIACAEYLIAEKYTAKARIVAHGFSAGGLLMGAIYTMRPDLWAGVIAQAPFVDVLNTIEDYESHPLGTTSFPIWGDPRVPEDHAYLASYSPYEALEPAASPALLALGGVADDRVAFWEPLKFAVKARALTTAGNPIMVKIAMTSGHMGASGSIAAHEQQALFIAFATWAADRRWGGVPQR